MANEEQVARLKAGVAGWNQWREAYPDTWLDLREANLAGLDLHGANLFEADLRSANLEGTNLIRADIRHALIYHASLCSTNLIDADLGWAKLIGANLSQAVLLGTNLTDARLYDANLTHANFNGANLSGANLSGADLSGADLQRVNFRGANLQRTNLSHAFARGTLFADVDLRCVQGLDTIQHGGPSSLSIDTLYQSGGDLPESFLRGCGVPDSMIEYARSLVAAERPIDYYSVFISYSSHDEALAERLHADLQARGVRCWYAPEDLKIGESILGGIDQGIRLHDKLLLLLSESSVRSTWVETEVNLALQRERAERRRVLFPVRIDDAVLSSGAAWAALVRADHHIGDFCQWKEHDRYQAVFARLLRDLRAGV